MHCNKYRLSIYLYKSIYLGAEIQWRILQYTFCELMKFNESIRKPCCVAMRPRNAKNSI